LLTDADFAARADLPKGYIGPDFEGAKHVIADSSVRAPHPWITGANEVDHHVRGSVLGRDFTPTQWAEIAIVEPGDACPTCGEPLRIDRGIEVGHVFQLGTKYTEALGAHYTDEDGEQHPMVMGCYGIGVSRIIAAVVEEHHDDKGIAWPAALAPYDVEVIAMPGDTSMVEAEVLCVELERAGLDVLFDDREVRPGVKFADADLVGLPVQVIVGEKGITRGIVERKIRATGERDEIARVDAVATLVAGARP
jgi:prolyl-tRNA synthetase